LTALVQRAARVPALAGSLWMVLGGCALAVAFCERTQIGNGFTVLLGDRYDAVIELAILEHWRNVLRGLSQWSTTFYFHPAPATLGYNDGFFLYGLAYSLFRALGIDPFLAGELVDIAVRAVGFLAFHAACRRILGLASGWALLGAVLFTISNGMFIQDLHAQLLSVAFAPLLALLLHGAATALRAGQPRLLLAWGAGAVALHAAWLMTGFYMAWFFCFFGVATMLAWLAQVDAARRRRLWSDLRGAALPLLALLLLGVLANLPFLTLYLPKAAETGMHGFGEALFNTPAPFDLVNVGEGNLLLGWLVALLNEWLRPGYPQWSERITGLAPGLLLVFGLALVWLLRGRGRGASGETPAPLLRAMAVAAVVSWLLTVRVGVVTDWLLVYLLVPGARAVRVVARYQLFLAGPVIAVSVAYLASQARRIAPATLALICVVLVGGEVNVQAPVSLSRTRELARLDALPPPPAECPGFFASAARAEPEKTAEVDAVYSHNVDAMLIAELLRLPTPNGIATFVPPGWDLVDPGSDRYRAQVARFAVPDLCALDLRTLRWDAHPRG